MLEVMSARNKIIYRLFVGIWIVANIIFWSWWFRGEHISSLPMFILMSASLLYETTIIPTFYLFYVGRMRYPVPVDPEPNMRVAMITPCVPHKESIALIERQLKAMVEVSYIHDSWVLDEDNDPRIRSLAARIGVKYFSRKGVEKYNQKQPPFQAKTKAGNVNAWIDVYGKDYDFFVQLDIDHRPHPDYLDKVLGYFADKKVAWVQAPSVYSNFHYWTARGSAEQELVLQGPLQMGFYGWSKTPFIIGSHATYRMSAIREIGGFQPTRAEDHLDTVVLARHGYKGVFFPKIIAEGDGPESFDTYLAQQFAWAYSMIQIFFYYMPKYILGYNKRQALQFLFVQTWYTFWSLSMAVMFVLPCLALLFNTPITAMPFGQFFSLYLPPWIIALVIWFWTRQWFQPNNLALSWRGLVLHIARWPIVLWAFVNVILGIKKPYMITTKGLAFGKSRTLNLSSQITYLGMVAFSFLSLWSFLILKGEGNAQGYLLFVLEGILMFTAVYSVVLVNDIRSMNSEGVKMSSSLSLRIKHILLLIGLWSALIASGLFAAVPIGQAIAWGPLPIVPLPDSLIVDSNRTKATQPLGYTPTPIETDSSFTSRKVAIGAYDPEGRLNRLPLAIQHSYVVWFLTDDFTKTVEAARQARRFPFISVEPWPLLINNLTADSLLEDINEGRYDQYIRKLAQVSKAQSPQIILLRWGHEMELTGLYPWSQGNPKLYITAYRRVVDIFREEKVRNVRWVWSPAGNRGATDYYPGDSYVDYIGVTILADQRWDREAGFPDLRSFETLLQEKYWLARWTGKPLIVAEVGVSATNGTEKKIWLRQAKASFSRYPLMTAFLYFNAVNTHVSLNDYRPDWSIDEKTFKEVFFN
jgi:cellulose synthase (UDP-forming)